MFVVSLGVGGGALWLSLRAGITDENIEAGERRATVLGDRLLEALAKAGPADDLTDLDLVGLSSCDGDATNFGSSQLIYDAGTHLTQPMPNEEIVQLLGIADLPGWRATGDYEGEDQQNGGQYRQLYFTNGDLSVRLTVSGQPERGQPYVSLSVSTDCYNNGASDIDGRRFG